MLWTKNTEIKDNYDKIVSDAENTYKLAEKLIEKEYQDAIQASNDELTNILTIAQQKLDTTLKSNEKVPSKNWQHLVLVENFNTWRMV